MSIKITPHGYRADITVDSMEEAREVLRELTPTTIGCFPPVAENTPAPSSSGLATESAATTATGVVEGGPVEASKRECRTWTPLEEEHLQVWYRDGCSVRQIADRLGRSWSSVNNKRLHLARGRDRLNLDPMREDEK